MGKWNSRSSFQSIGPEKNTSTKSPSATHILLLKSRPRIVRELDSGGLGDFVADSILIIDLASQADSHCRSRYIARLALQGCSSTQAEIDHLVQPNQRCVERELYKKKKDCHHDTTVPASRALGFLQLVDDVRPMAHSGVFRSRGRD